MTHYGLWTASSKIHEVALMGLFNEYAKIHDLDEGRVIARLLGCIERRIKQSIMPFCLPPPALVTARTV